MRDRKLIGFVVLATVLLTLHLADHVLRGDLRFPLTVEALPFLGISTVLYAIIGAGLWLYRKNKVGARFWTISATLGIVLGWLSHFSPFAEQNTAQIRGAYARRWPAGLRSRCWRH